RIQQSPGQLWVPPGGTAELSCHLGEDGGRSVNWYKEKRDGGLSWIHPRVNKPFPKGKYWERQETGGWFSLTIGSARREDSGVYYCSSSGLYPSFGNGTRLIVTNATEPQLSMLVDVEEAGSLPGRILLLCHLRHLPPGWDTVVWQPGGEVTGVTGVAMDEQGVLSAWSITWVSAERW
ncbi:KV1 protein, partial [Jacana jacana]|nr:KV1 protein [Jacana jacana]